VVRRKRPDTVEGRQVMDSWGAIWMVVWIGALLLSVWALIRRPDRAVHREALDVLSERFARGEINEQEFERARTVLRADSRGGIE
jgi:uncharacterized membrane protein